jgi:hypothetical protein
MAKLITNTRHNIARAVRHLKPLIEERQKMMAELGDGWADRPVDFLQWLIEEEDKSSVEHSQRILGVNFAAIHTSSMVSARAVG